MVSLRSLLFTVATALTFPLEVFDTTEGFSTTSLRELALSGACSGTGTQRVVLLSLDRRRRHGVLYEWQWQVGLKLDHINSSHDRPHVRGLRLSRTSSQDWP